MNIKSFIGIKFYFSLGFLCLIFILYLLGSPVDFPINSVFQVEEGRSLRGISLDLKENKIIRSRTVFETFVILYKVENKILNGYYSFDKKLSVIEIARRIALNDKRMPPVRVTFPEGFNVLDMAELLSKKISNFNKDSFVSIAVEYEGYLFPDTYFFMREEKPEGIVKALNNNYKKKIQSLMIDIEKSGKTESSIINMASVIEKEASGNDDREVISGILWKRLSIGMPLQADAAPETYEKKGLPTTPIANPGLKSIKASIYPKNSPYLFYLHDKGGKIYYARNFDEHKANIEKYLR
ncbi:MAG: endolytic transglycosylase MltG [Candidatus Pacebacteria bacterium]|nr:endolytic transglycosylase MltG [Candidatus Paceibacterota bacterium]MCF7862928.1 endolytic transglycosylase MltG [Candidatus Paceibacterota bacterium]